MESPNYTALLSRLASVNVAALIMDHTGRVYQWNALSVPFRQSGANSHWQDFCFNHDTQLPLSGAPVVYWNAERKATAARLITTALHESGFTLALFLDQDECSSQQGKLGFVIYEPYLKQCFWSEYAAALHDEYAPYFNCQKLKQFLQWYAPHQRDRLLYAILECEQTHLPQQVTLRVAHSNKRLRYLWLTLPINGKPLTCAFIRSVVQVSAPAASHSRRPVTVS